MTTVTGIVVLCIYWTLIFYVCLFVYLYKTGLAQILICSLHVLILPSTSLVIITTKQHPSTLLINPVIQFEDSDYKRCVGLYIFSFYCWIYNILSHMIKHSNQCTMVNGISTGLLLTCLITTMYYYAVRIILRLLYIMCIIVVLCTPLCINEIM